MVEWAERAWEVFPPEHLLVRLEIAGARERELTLRSARGPLRAAGGRPGQAAARRPWASLELTIDTASEMASVALSREGALEAELTWRCPRNHSAELLPAVQYLMQRAGVDKSELTAVFVCIGPGSYTGLRVGIASAKGLAFALGLPIVGVGRLEADAYQHADFARAHLRHPSRRPGRAGLGRLSHRAPPAGGRWCRRA